MALVVIRFGIDAIRIVSPFVLPFVIEYAGITTGRSEPFRRAYYEHQGLWACAIFGCGLGAGVTLLVLRFRWFGIGMAIPYVPVMYYLMLFYAIGLAGGI